MECLRINETDENRLIVELTPFEDNTVVGRHGVFPIHLCKNGNTPLFGIDFEWIIRCQRCFL
ncbi:MAG: hypothetical protein A4E58_00012 [Syntrophorhabdus sp. PtaB.Bin006]|nr:MAG: hypothetical protein A4E58_00012 [Syntrophorhabdus sp. PtaB.Bin006]